MNCPNLHLLPLFLLVILPAIAWCQEDNQPPKDTLDGVLLDTVKVWYVLEDDPVRRVPDTTIQGFWRYNPAIQNWNEYAHLGNFGSPTYALTWQPTLRRGFFTGLEQYDLYRLRSDQLRYFRSKFPFTELYYTQAGQANAMVMARFGQSFPGGLSMTVDYRLINQVGQYANQRVRHENIGVALRYESPKGRYNASAGYVNHKVRHQENGGLTDVASLEGPVSFPNTLPVRLSTAQTNHRHNELFFHQSYSPWSDSAGFGGRFYHRLTWRSDWYKFYDKSLATDSSFYGNFQTNNRGVRHFLHVKTLENQFWYEQRLGKKAFLFTAGLEHQYLNIYHEPERSQKNTLFAIGSLRSDPASEGWFRLNARGHFGLLGQVGDFGLDATVALEWAQGRWGVLEGRFLYQMYTPALIQRELLVSQAVVWRNDLNKVQEVMLGGAYALPRWGLRVGFHSYLLGNFIYFNEQATVSQLSVPDGFIQLYAEHLLKLWKIRWQNRFVWQPNQRTVQPMPVWQLRSNLAFETNIFKKRMKLQIGADMRWQAAFQGYAYFPLTGQFYLQTAQELTFYPLVDAYIAFRVKRFRVFVMGENLTQDFFQKGIFQVLSYPMPFRQIRFGASWFLSN